MRRTALLLLLAVLPLTTRAAINGRVVAEDGAPIANARIRAYVPESTADVFARVLSDKQERVPIATATTNASGVFTLDPKRNSFVELVADADGHAYFTDDVADGDEPSIVLATAAPRKARVLANGKPVANALIVFNRMVFVRTDEKGESEIADPLVWARRVDVFHPDYAPVKTAFDRGGKDVSLDITFPTGARVTTKVVDEKGQPVAGASVFIDGLPAARTFADGTLTLPHPGSGQRIFINAGSRAATFAGEPPSTIRVTAATILNGTFRNIKDDTPVAGARVIVARGFEEGGGLIAVTDAKGNFTIDGLLGTSTMVILDHPNFARRSQDTRLGEPRITRSFAAMPVARVVGVLVDDDKKPVAAARITVLGPSSTNTATGPDGRFSIRLFPGGFGSSLQFTKPGYAPALYGPLQLQPGEVRRNVTVKLPRGFRFELRAIDASGAPVANEPVELWFYPDPDTRWTRRALPCTQADAAKCRATDAKGAWVAQLAAGKYDIHVGGKSTVQWNQTERMLDARSSPLTVTLDRGAPVEGRVTWSDQSPLGDVAASVSSDAGRETEVLRDGTFSVRLPAGRVTLRAETMTSPPISGEAIEVTAPATGVVLVIPKPGRIEGRVTDKATKQPVKDFSVSTTRTDLRMYDRPKPVHDEEGRYTITNVAPGTVEVVVNAPGYVRGSIGGIEVEKGKSATADVALDRGATVTGKVTSEGRPVPDVNVRVTAPATTLPMFNNDTATATTDANGDYTLDGVALGTQSVTFTKEGYVAARKTVSAEAGKSARLDVDMQHGRELRGRVLDSTGQPVANARLSAQPQGAQTMYVVSNVRSDTEGTFRLDALLDQPYTVIAEREGYMRAQVADVNPSTTPSVTITLERGGTINGHVTGLSPIEMGNVMISMTGQGTLGKTRADSTGSFTLSGIPDGQVTLIASVTEPRRRESSWKRVEVVNGSAPPVEINFEEGIAIGGRLLRRGAPVPYGFIVLTPVAAGSSTPVRGPSGNDGTYQMNVPAPGEYRVSVSLPGGGVVIASNVQISGPTTHDIDVSGAMVRGHALDGATGAPLAGVAVELEPLQRGPILRGGTDSTGHFLIDLVSDGTYHLKAARDGYAEARQDVVVQDGQSPEVEVRLNPGEALVVRVVDATNMRPVEASVAAFNERNDLVSRGHAVSLEDPAHLWVAPGRYRVQVTAVGYVSTNAEAMVPGPDVQVMLTRGGRVEVRGATTERMVRLRDAAGRVIASTALPPGIFESVAAGTYTLEAIDEHQVVVAKKPVVVRAGETTVVTLD